MRYWLIVLILTGCSSSEQYDVALIDEGCEVKCDWCVNLSVGCMEGVDISGSDQYRDVVIPTKPGKRTIKPTVIIETREVDQP